MSFVTQETERKTDNQCHSAQDIRGLTLSVHAVTLDVQYWNKANVSKRKEK